jgi:hypothetical protein
LAPDIITYYYNNRYMIRAIGPCFAKKKREPTGQRREGIMLVLGRNGIVPASCVVSLKINNKVIYTTASELDGVFEMDIPLDEALEVLELYCSKPNIGSKRSLLMRVILPPAMRGLVRIIEIGVTKFNDMHNPDFCPFVRPSVRLIFADGSLAMIAGR